MHPLHMENVIMIHCRFHSHRRSVLNNNSGLPMGKDTTWLLCRFRYIHIILKTMKKWNKHRRKTKRNRHFFRLLWNDDLRSIEPPIKLLQILFLKRCIWKHRQPAPLGIHVASNIMFIFLDRFKTSLLTFELSAASLYSRSLHCLVSPEKGNQKRHWWNVSMGPTGAIWREPSPHRV